MSALFVIVVGFSLQLYFSQYFSKIPGIKNNGRKNPFCWTAHFDLIQAVRDPIKDDEPLGTHFTISDSKFSDAFGQEDKGVGNNGGQTSYNQGVNGMSHKNDSAYINMIIIYIMILLNSALIL